MIHYLWLWNWKLNIDSAQLQYWHYLLSMEFIHTQAHVPVCACMSHAIVQASQSLTAILFTLNTTIRNILLITSNLTSTTDARELKGMPSSNTVLILNFMMFQFIQELSDRPNNTKSLSFFTNGWVLKRRNMQTHFPYQQDLGLCQQHWP